MISDGIPDVRDGLTRLERIILFELHRLQAERPGRESVPCVQLWGRVIEHIDCSQDQLQAVLARLTDGRHGVR